ncbi:MAG: TolC family protein [Myxococcota bacterium]
MIGLFLIGSAYGIDLGEARRASAQRAIGVQRQQAALDRARGERLASLANTLPQVRLFAAATTASGPNLIGRFTSRQLQGGITGSWRLVDPSSWGAAAAARSTVRGETALLDWTRAMARRDATVAFASAVSAVEVAAALREAEEDALEASDGIRSLADAGLRPRADAVQAQALAASLTAERVAAEGEIGATCAALQAQMGVTVDGHCDLDAPETWPEPVTSDVVHPAIRSAEAALTAARRARGASVAQLAPTIVGTAEASQGVGTAEVGDNALDLGGLSLSAGLRAEVPLMASGATVAAMQQATAERGAAEVALDEQQRLLDSGRVAAEARYQAALASVDASTQSLLAAREALVLVEARYEQGLTDLTTLLEARRTRDRALVALAVARAEQGRALGELEVNRGVVQEP